MISIKPTVRIYGTQPEMVTVRMIVASVFHKHSEDCKITSSVGKKHSKYSLHPVGFADDYRTKHLTDFKVASILIDLRYALPCCDIIHEYKGEPEEHFHVEFDPKDDPIFQMHKKHYRRTGEWNRNL